MLAMTRFRHRHRGVVSAVYELKVESSKHRHAVERAVRLVRCRRRRQPGELLIPGPFGPNTLARLETNSVLCLSSIAELWGSTNASAVTSREQLVIPPLLADMRIITPDDPRTREFLGHGEPRPCLAQRPTSNKRWSHICRRLAQRDYGCHGCAGHTPRAGATCPDRTGSRPRSAHKS